MPTQPPTSCLHPGCTALVSGRPRCPDHTRVVRREIADRRGGSTERGYGGRWQRARLAFLAQHPLCSCGSLAEVVDHITPHKGDAALFWNSANWQPLCASCHNRKTVAQDGGFGRKTQVNR